MISEKMMVELNQPVESFVTLRQTSNMKKRHINQNTDINVSQSNRRIMHKSVGLMNYDDDQTLV